ncbi:MAG: endo alpha-1,4 polygalactosaminidase [Desulfovibrionaceae bacterium]|nr:endo alpha-1,4 polygalactosaminidase [Desulfovibrionaceae bacterium]
MRLGPARSILILAGLCLALCSCSARGQKTGQARLAGVRAWAVWLQKPDITRLSAAPFDLAVIDFSRDGTDRAGFSSRDVARLKASGKIVLCYLSIGEAESYRFYWRPSWTASPPAFLGPENPDWPGNFKVRYWLGQWWDLALAPSLERIMAAGFDGLYLDIVDAYWFWGEKEGRVRPRADQMIELVMRIADHCRARQPGFLIAPQNGLGVIDESSPDLSVKYLEKIDLVGIEDLFFNFSDQEDQKRRLALAQRVAQSGRPVCDLEYVGPDKYPAYREMVRKQPFRIIPYPAAPDRALDRLTRDAAAVLP